MAILPTVPTITQGDVFQALGTLIAALGVEPIQGQANRVAQPMQKNFAVMTPMRQPQIATNLTTYYGPGGTTKLLTMPQELSYQVDFHGPDAASYATLFQTLFRDPFGVDLMAGLGTGIAPCYVTDPVQTPFIDGEQQFEDRWTCEAVMQGNPQTLVPQQYADVVTPVIKPPANTLR